MTNNSHHEVKVTPGCLPGVTVIDIVSDRTFPRHAHDQFGIGVMRSGGHVSWSAVGPVEAGPGDVIAVSPNEIHDGAPVSETRSWAMIFVEPETVAQLVGQKAASREIAFAACHDPMLSAQVEKVAFALRNGYADAADDSLTALFADLLAPPRADGTFARSIAVQRALNRIHDMPTSPPSLDEIAGTMEMERTSALRRFRAEVGATPFAYALQLRVRMARRLLERGVPLAEIACDLGFADQSHLTRVFLRQFGVPPGRYRRAIANIIQDG